MSVYNHENFIPIELDSIIWRYLDFEKFKSLLETQSLFFCRADKFSDPFEGSIPKKEADYRIKEEEKMAKFFGREFDETQSLKNIIGTQSLHQRFKTGTIINCWHINKNESDAMWRLYLKDNEGVAIQTNKERITKVIEKMPEEIAMSKVRYLDYDKDIWYHPVDYPHTHYNFFIPFLHKRIEFVHENEFRLFHQIDEAVNNENYWDDKPNHKGNLISIDLNLLIEKIYLPSTIDDKASMKIIQFSKDLGFNFQFEKSRLSSSPNY